MTKIEFEIDTDDNIPLIARPTHNRRLYPEYASLPSSASHYVPPSFNQILHRPIKDVRVENLSGRSGSKPCYLYAEIFPNDVGSGQQTSFNTALALQIRQRGKPTDDCGHIIAAQLGGKMVEFNLFPQAHTINRGWYGLNKLWRRGVEQVMRAWLTLPENVHPKVLFEIILFYNCTDYPNRPNKTKFVVTLESDSNEEETEENEEPARLLDPVLKAELLNELKAEVSEAISAYERINWTNFSCHFGNNYGLFAQFLKEILLAILVEGPAAGGPIPVPTPKPTPDSTPRPAPRGSNTPFSWWDLVPVVGDVRSICQGIEDAEDGNVLGATANIALGLSGMVLNAMSLGAAGALVKTATKEGGKVVVKEAGKQVAKTTTRQVATQVAKEVVKDTAVVAIRAGQALKWSSFLMSKQGIRI